MDFRFSPEQEAWRREIRDFIQRELPAELRSDELPPGGEEAWRLALKWTRTLGKKQWLGIAWPPEYGGLGKGIIEQMIFNEEMAYNRAPNVALTGTGFLGPTILTYGTEEQKRQHIPKILAGEVVWCQGFSEPNAGSDLASLRTRAERDGDDWIINGQKIWTSNAHRSEWIFIGARTNPQAPKHKGISMFIFPMDTPGITVRPLPNLVGDHHFNETFFENVRVPASALLGEQDRGWYQMATALDFERTAISGAATMRRQIEDYIRYAKATTRDGRPLSEHPHIRSALADFAIQVDVARALSYRVASLQSSGKVPNYEASIVKLFTSELNQRLSNFGTQLLGLYGSVEFPSKRAVNRGKVGRSYWLSFTFTIGGGTSEIQRNIIATRGLGLPR